MRILAPFIAIGLSCWAATAAAEPFDQGSVNVSIGGSLRVGGGDTIFAAGLGVGYFVIDGLELGVGTTAFFGADPFIAQVTPGVRYVFWMVPVVSPYLGAFYRHWFIADDFPDIDTVGGRAGILFAAGGPVNVGLGVVYERIISPCSTACDRVYPELSISISF